MIGTAGSGNIINLGKETHMSNKTLGVVLIIVGVLMVIAVLLMGFIGYPSLGFGWKKITMAVVGVIIALIGVGLQMRSTNPNK